VHEAVRVAIFGGDAEREFVGEQRAAERGGDGMIVVVGVPARTRPDQNIVGSSVRRTIAPASAFSP